MMAAILNDAQKRLASAHAGICRAMLMDVCKRVWRRVVADCSMSGGDVLGVIHTNYVRCASAFDPAKAPNGEQSFVGFVWRYTFRQSVAEILRAKKRPPSAPLSVLAMAYNPPHPVNVIDRHDIFEAIEPLIDKRLCRILRLRYREGMTLAAIGNEIGVTEERTRQLISRAVKMLRARLPDPERGR